MSNNSSLQRHNQTLFDKDGVSLIATILSPNNSDSDDDHNGIILTLSLHRQHEKNVVNPTLISLLIEALDIIDTHPLLVNTNNKALIITGLSFDDNSTPQAKTPKFFSNGLDLQWMLQASGKSPSSTLIESYNSQVLARILTLPFTTIAAINGHCIGAGLFLSLSTDYRIMRTKRGYISWPEANLGMRLTKGFSELSRAKISNHKVLREGILTAKKYTSSEALVNGIVDVECDIEELYNVAFDRAVEGLPESMNLEIFDPKAYSKLYECIIVCMRCIHLLIHPHLQIS